MGARHIRLYVMTYDCDTSDYSTAEYESVTDRPLKAAAFELSSYEAVQKADFVFAIELTTGKTTFIKNRFGDTGQVVPQER